MLRSVFIYMDLGALLWIFYKIGLCLSLCEWAGGFGGNIGHDPHLLYTLSAIQVLALFDKIDVLDVEKVSNCILYPIVWCIAIQSFHNV